MDGQRFDNLARALARGTSRREVLKGVIGAAGGLIGLSNRAAEARVRRTDPQPTGSPCSSPRDCASGFCVDGVCCDSLCTGQCATCVSGSCAPIPAGQRPADGRPACPGSGPCQAVCDGVTLDSCATFPGAETVCGDSASTCSNGFHTTYACGGNGTCAPTTTSCAPYLCLADGTGCATSCQSDDECQSTAYCLSGQCVGDQPLGQSCDHGGQCQSGTCANGVCCNTACDGACEVCGSDGFCGPVADDTVCAGGACCHGDCVDTSSDIRHCGNCETACTMTASEAICHTSICNDGTCDLAVTPGRPCDDGDACTTGTTCQADGACGGGTPVVCADDKLDCTSISCDPSQGCVTTIADGMCAIDGACYSANERNPNNTCQWCDPKKHTTDWTYVPKGTHCLDGNKCNGEEACDGEGTCETGVPVTCGECQSCNADTGNCDPVAQGTACGTAAYCTNGTAHAADQCDASGQCTPGTNTICAPYACGSDDACLSSCSDDAPCTSGYYCDSSGTCQQQVPLTNACTNDVECLSGACAGGACCPSNLACGDTCCESGYSCADDTCTCAEENQCRDAQGNLVSCCASADLCQSDGTCCAPANIMSNGDCCDATLCGDTCCDSGENCFYGPTEDDPTDHLFCACFADRLCFGQCCAAGNTCFREYVEDLGVYYYGCCDGGQACGEKTAGGYYPLCCPTGTYCQSDGSCGACPNCEAGEQCLPNGTCCDGASVCTAGDGSKTCCVGGTCGADGSCCEGGCADGEICIGGACCAEDLACVDSCCTTGETCLIYNTDISGSGTTVDAGCCPTGRACHTSLGVAKCCDEGKTCIGYDTCCPDANVCGDQCCGDGQSCSMISSWNGNDYYACVATGCGDDELATRDGCCPFDRACDFACCPEGQTCKPQADPNDSYCCDEGENRCGNDCCPSDKTCYNSDVCCSAERYFADGAHGEDGFCCDGANHYVDMDLGLLEVRICCDANSLPYNKGPFGVDMGCCPAESLKIKCAKDTGCHYECFAQSTGLMAYEKIWG